jgi:hypothetical protein
MSVCLSVRMEQLGSQLMDSHEIWYLSIFRKSIPKIQVSLIFDKNNEHFRWKQPDFFFITSRLMFLRMRNVSDKIRMENQNTCVMFSCFLLFRKSYHLWHKVEKYFTARRDTDGNVAHGMLDI